MVDWETINTVLLDMDGTLLDLHFDDFFWREHVPRRFSEKHNLDLESAKEELFHRYRKFEGSLEWYCVDFWSTELGLDIPVLKKEVDHLIAIQPCVLDFLAAVRARGGRTVLVTNAHGKSLRLKMDRTQLQGHLDSLVCAHDLGLPKEDPRFWDLLKSVEPFEPDRTLLVDDSLPVLESARIYGIRFLVAVRQPNRQKPLRDIKDFPAISSFEELLPV